MTIKANRSVGKQGQKSFFNSRSFTIILTVGSLVVTGLVGGLFEYLGGQLAQNATTSTDPFDNPQPNVFTEWLNRPDFIKLKAKFEGEDKPFTFWDIGYWVDEVEGKVVGGQNKYRFKYVNNPNFLDGDPWHWEFNISDPRFQILNEQYASNGFKLYKRQEFKGTNGQNRNQAIWRFDPQHVSRTPKAPPPKPNNMEVELPETLSNDSKQSNKSPDVAEQIASGQEVLQRTDSNMDVVKVDKTLQRARGSYRYIDSNGDGQITADDMLGSPQGKQAKITTTIKRLDKDGDGSVSFDEFLLDPERDYSDGTAFSNLDKNKDNFLSLSEFLFHHKKQIENSTKEFKRLDKNADSRLSFDEFRKS